MLNEKAVVSSKGQVVIPREIRNILGIHSGTELVFSVHKGFLEVKPIKQSIDNFFGCCKDSDQSALSIKQIDEAIAEAVSKNNNIKKQKGKKK